MTENNNQNIKKINYNIVFLRMLAIVIVVFGHSIIIYDSNWGLYSSSIKVPILETIKKYINYIQMPLYMAISGYVFAYTRETKYYKLIANKAKRLLIPFIVVGIFYLMPLRYILGNTGYVNNSLIYNIFYNLILGNDNGHLWFLPTLYIIFLITGILIKFKNKSRIVQILFLVISIFILSINNIMLPYINEVFKLLVFFIIGYIINKNSEGKLFNRTLYAFFGVSLVLLMVVSYYYNSNIINSYLENVIVICICIIMFKIKWEKVFKLKILEKIVTLISNNSFGIYLFHSPLIYIIFKYFPDIHPILMIGINFFAFGGLALCISIILRKTRLRFLV